MPTLDDLDRSRLDLTRLDLNRVDWSRVDFTRVDLTNFDVAAFIQSDPGRIARAALDLTAKAVRESTYVTVGLTVLGIQRLQVRRREFQRAVRR